MAIANAQFSQWQARFRNLAMEAYTARELRSKPDTANFDHWRAQQRESFSRYGRAIPPPTGPLEREERASLRRTGFRWLPAFVARL